MRIVALAAEVPDILDRLGAWDLLVGASVHAVRPAKVRELPRVGGFARPDLDRVLALEPDLVVATSCVQAEAASRLAGCGVSVLVLSPHTLADIYESIRILGGAIGRRREAEALVSGMQEAIEGLRAEAALERPVRVFFEEWPEPLIAGIGWVSDLIRLFGGEDVCAREAARRDPKARVMAPEEVAARAPEIVLASWCGRRVRPERIRARPGWREVPAVRRDRIFALPSEDVLQWGPGLVRGARAIRDALLAACRE